MHRNVTGRLEGLNSHWCSSFDYQTIEALGPKKLKLARNLLLGETIGAARGGACPLDIYSLSKDWQETQAEMVMGRAITWPDSLVIFISSPI